jgi:hypothetical protein
MALYFPEDLRRTPYAQVYQRLTPVERLMLLREFVGVTYRRRFVYFLNQASASRRKNPGFRSNLSLAASRQYQNLVIGRRAWRREARLKASYLRLIFRHYLFGYLVQGLRPRLAGSRLPAPEPGCYYDFYPNLAAILWFNRHRALCDDLLEELVVRVIEEDERRLYVYALLAASQLCRLPSFAEMLESVEELVNRASRPGRTPLGVELEFSNLGRFATFDQPFGRGLSDPGFDNMRWYEDFFLDDVCWRLGGYLDTHIRGRDFLKRLKLGGRPGGFFEYSLVRLDYPRSFSLPLSRDCGLVALYIDEVIRFVAELRPHSLHVNFEKIAFGERRPELDDYLCLLLLGGDFQSDEKGKWRECRMADNELRGVIQRRRHRPERGKPRREVIEYAFLRLKPPALRESGYFPILMACKGFQHGYNLDLSCRDQVQGMVAWAHHPRPLPEASLARFPEAVELGWAREGGLDEVLRREPAAELGRLLARANRRLAAPGGD